MLLNVYLDDVQTIAMHKSKPSLPPSLPTCISGSISSSIKNRHVVIPVLGKQEKLLVVVVGRDGGFGHDGGDPYLE